MVRGHRPIFTSPTPQRLSRHSHPSPKPPPQSSPTCSLNVSVRGAFPSRRNHLLLLLLCCDSSCHQGLVVVTPRREERGCWLAFSLFLTFNRVTTNAASEPAVKGGVPLACCLSETRKKKSVAAPGDFIPRDGRYRQTSSARHLT